MNRVKLPEARLRLAYFGTPELARTILSAILDENADDVVLVVCQPDKPKGRGNKLEAPPVKELAIARGIPVVQPTKMKDGVLTAALKEQRIDLAIVAAFGRILPQDMLDAPRFGCWNVHASLLPQHRGASPIQQSLLDGDTETGVTLMQMSAGLDEGPMLLEERIPIASDETTPTLTEKLAGLGARLVLRGIREAKASGLTLTPQDNARATFAPIIEKAAGKLDLTEPAIALDRRIRALNPWPGTWIEVFGGEILKILPSLENSASRGVEVGQEYGTPGSILSVSGALQIAVGAGSLIIRAVQPAGKRPMAAADYLRGAGRSLTIGGRLGDR
ncbi:MAG: methionyl-tRNA formyltransferase [Myxococcota bacterium]